MLAGLYIISEWPPVCMKRHFQERILVYMYIALHENLGKNWTNEWSELVHKCLVFPRLLRSMPNADHWQSKLISIDRNWSTLGSMPAFFIVLTWPNIVDMWLSSNFSVNKMIFYRFAGASVRVKPILVVSPDKNKILAFLRPLQQKRVSLQSGGSYSCKTDHMRN